MSFQRDGFHKAKQKKHNVALVFLSGHLDRNNSDECTMHKIHCNTVTVRHFIQLYFHILAIAHRSPATFVHM
jgi:hypothetical protein